MTKANGNIRLQRVVVFAGVVLLAGKFTAYLLTRSNAILSDALESIVNVITAFFALYSLRLSAKPPDSDHPYGHGKIEFISASIEGLLILLAGLFIIGKTVYSFFYPHPLQQLNTGIIIVAASGALNFLLGFFCERQGRKTDSMALIASGRHLKSDALTTAGILVALLLIFLTGAEWIDNVVAAAFGLLICVIGWRLLRKAAAGIMDEADYVLLRKIISQLDAHRRPAWIDLHNMRVIKYGSVLHVDCHLTVPWYYNVRQAHDEVEAMDEEIRKAVNNPVEFSVHTDACVPPAQCSLCMKTDCPERQAPFEKRVEWNLKTTLRDRKHGL